jgi:transposase
LAYRRKGFVQCVEDAPLADRGSDAVPIHVGAQILIDSAEHQLHPATIQVIDQVAQRSCRGIVQVRDWVGIPTNQRTQRGQPQGTQGNLSPLTVASIVFVCEQGAEQQHGDTRQLHDARRSNDKVFVVHAASLATSRHAPGIPSLQKPRSSHPRARLST